MLISNDFRSIQNYNVSLFKKKGSLAESHLQKKTFIIACLIIASIGIYFYFSKRGFKAYFKGRSENQTIQSGLAKAKFEVQNTQIVTPTTKQQVIHIPVENVKFDPISSQIKGVAVKAQDEASTALFDSIIAKPKTPLAEIDAIAASLNTGLVDEEALLPTLPHQGNKLVQSIASETPELNQNDEEIIKGELSHKSQISLVPDLTKMGETKPEGCHVIKNDQECCKFINSSSIASLKYLEKNSSLHECACHSRNKLPIRSKFEDELIQQISKKFPCPSSSNLTLCSIASGGCLAELVIHARLVELGYGVNWILVDPTYYEKGIPQENPIIIDFKKFAEILSPQTKIAIEPDGVKSIDSIIKGKAALPDAILMMIPSMTDLPSPIPIIKGKDMQSMEHCILHLLHQPALKNTLFGYLPGQKYSVEIL